MDASEVTAAGAPRFVPRRTPLPQNVGKRRAERIPLNLPKDTIEALYALTRQHRRRYSRIRDLALLVLSYEYGLRASEPGRILLADLDLTSPLPSITIRRAKRGRIITHPIEAHVLPILREYLAVRRLPPGTPRPLPASQDFLFPSQKCRRLNGIPQVVGLSNKRVNFISRSYMAHLAGLVAKGASHHTLRHSVATHLVNEGVDIRVIADRLGHRDISSTQIYADVSAEARAGLARRLERSSKIAKP